MLQTPNKIATHLQDDPLFAGIQDIPLEEALYTDSYLTEIIEKNFTLRRK